MILSEAPPSRSTACRDASAVRRSRSGSPNSAPGSRQGSSASLTGIAPPFVERRVDVDEIADMGAVEDGRPEFRRLDRVLAAAARQRLADENHAGQPIEQAHFAHGVGDIDLRRRLDRLAQRALGARDRRPRQAAMSPPRCEWRGASTVSRPGNCRGELLVDAQRQRLFAGMGGGGDPDRARSDLAARASSLAGSPGGASTSYLRLPTA